jgi:RNA polymerase sigma-70 factor (ECF subfamily)
MSADSQFEELVQLYYDDLYRFGFSLTRSEFDAADLTQQTFYIWARKGHQLRANSSAKTWLFTTLYREFLQTRRRRERVSDQSVDELLDEIPCISADAVNHIDIETMLECFGRLDPHYSGPLILYYMEDLAYREIAQILEIPLGTVQSRIARGKLQLYALLTGEPAPRTTARLHG